MSDDHDDAVNGMDDLIEQMAEAIQTCGAATYGYGYPWSQCSAVVKDRWRLRARAALGALKDAGYAVVKLPEPGPEVRHEGDLFAFPNETCCDVRVTWSRQVVYDNDWMAASEARSLAASLLAAARQAELADAKAQTPTESSAANAAEAAQ